MFPTAWTVTSCHNPKKTAAADDLMRENNRMKTDKLQWSLRLVFFVHTALLHCRWKPGTSRNASAVLFEHCEAWRRENYRRGSVRALVSRPKANALVQIDFIKILLDQRKLARKRPPGRGLLISGSIKEWFLNTASEQWKVHDVLRTAAAGWNSNCR